MQNGEKISNNNSIPESTWDSLKDFAGEQNLNSKTGKARTFSEFDIYPRMPGESNEEYGERLKFMHEKTAEYEAAESAKAEEATRSAEKDAYFASEQGQKELDEEARFDRLTEKLDQAVAEGRMSAEHAKNLLERQLERSVEEIEGHRQDYKDRQSVGTPEEEARYEEWFRSRGLLDSEQPIKSDTEQIEITETSEAPKAPELPEVQEDVVDKEPTVELLPEIQADLDDKLADIAKWRERDANRIWRGESGHSQEFYDKMVADVTAEAVATNRALLETQAAKSEQEPVAESEQMPTIEPASTSELASAPELESTSLHEIEETSIHELEEAAKHEQAIAELENRIREAKLELLAEKEKRIALLKERIATVKEELSLISKAKKKSRFGLLSRIFSRTKPSATNEVKTSTSEESDIPVAEEDITSAVEEIDTPSPAEEKPFNLADSIRQDRLGGKLDDEGVDILTNEDGLSDKNSLRIASWWANLDDGVKHEIVTFEKGLGNSKYGRALRVWLQINGVI